MAYELFASKIGYACIFSNTIESAVNNLTRLIGSGDCGYDEGVTAWRTALTGLLINPEALIEMNRFGAGFTSEQWVQILEQVHAILSSTSGAGE
jgi:hypothetical protein